MTSLPNLTSEKIETMMVHNQDRPAEEIISEASLTIDSAISFLLANRQKVNSKLETFKEAYIDLVTNISVIASILEIELGDLSEVLEEYEDTCSQVVENDFILSVYAVRANISSIFVDFFCIEAGEIPEADEELLATSLIDTIGIVHNLFQNLLKIDIDGLISE